jgi:hypothetical protein
MSDEREQRDITGCCKQPQHDISQVIEKSLKPKMYKWQVLTLRTE